MAMHKNIHLKDGVKVDLYAETGVARGAEIRWQNVGNTRVFHYSDNVELAADDRSTYKLLLPSQEDRASGDQYVQVWSDYDGVVSVESL